MQHPKKFNNQHYAGSIKRFISVFYILYKKANPCKIKKKKNQLSYEAKHLLILNENNSEVSNSEHESGSKSESEKNNEN